MGKIPLKEHLEAIIGDNDRRYQERYLAQEQAIRDALVAQKEAVAQALSSAEKAVTKAETATVARFESVNEFRGQLNDQANRLLPRAEFEAQHGEVIRQIDEIKAAMAMIRQDVAVGPSSLRGLQTVSDQQMGARASSANARTLLLAIVGLAITVVLGMATIITVVLTSH